MEESLLQFSKQMWSAAERSQLGRMVRGIAETEGVTLKNAVVKGVEKAGELAPKDVVVFSSAVKKMRNGGGHGAPAEVHVPTTVHFPSRPKIEVPKWELPGMPSRPIEMPRRRAPQEFPGVDFPPEMPNRRRFPGLDEEGGMPPLPVILPPKGPKNPPLRAARQLELVH